MPDAADLSASSGQGKQATAQAAAVAAVRPIRRLRVFSPNAGGARRSSRLAKAGSTSRWPRRARSPRAVEGSAIVTTVTRARERSSMPECSRPASTSSAIGAITPERREISPDLAGRAALVVADQSRCGGGSRRSCARPPTSYRCRGWSRRARDPARRRDHALQGDGDRLADLAVAIEVLGRAAARGVGRSFPHPEKAAPRLQGGT